MTMITELLFFLILTLQITKDITVRLQLRSFKKQPTFNQTHALGFPFTLVYNESDRFTNVFLKELPEANPFISYIMD